MSRRTHQPRDVTSFNGSLRVVIYGRLPDVQTAKSYLIIDEELAQARTLCATNAWLVVGECLETTGDCDGNGPAVFQRLIDQAGHDARAFDIILIHAHSHLFQNDFAREATVGRLADAGVRLVSTVQEIDDDPVGVLVRQVIARFDEYQSRQLARS